MAARFRIDQTGPGPGVTDRSRSDLVAGQEISLLVPDPVPGATYTWELIHKVGSAAALLASTGASVSIGPGASIAAPCGFMIELTETVGATSTRQRRAAFVRAPLSGLRPLLFGETASPGARLAARAADTSTDNETRADLGGTGETGQTWAGYTDALFELLHAVEELYSRNEAEGAAALVSGQWQVAPTVFRLRVIGTGLLVVDEGTLGNLVATAGIHRRTYAAADATEYLSLGNYGRKIRATFPNTLQVELVK